MVVTVGAKRTLNYTVEALSQLNRSESSKLCGIGQCIAKAAEVSHILANNFEVQVGQANILHLTRDKVRFTGVDIPIKTTRNAGDARKFGDIGEEDKNIAFLNQIGHSRKSFVSFPIYHLLLDLLLFKNKAFSVRVWDKYGLKKSKQDERIAESETSILQQDKRLDEENIYSDIDLLRIKPTETGFACEPGTDLRTFIREKDEACEAERFGKKEEDGDGKYTSNPRDDITNALARAGLLLSNSWESTTKRLGEYDDVVLGVDTNILMDCVLSQQLLDGFVFSSVGDHIYTPNWALLIIPNSVMHEIEQVANSRNGKGYLTEDGRRGFRALGELLELDQSNDMLGTSLLIVGEANPVLDTRVELRALRQEMAIAASRKRLKSSAGDTIIRDQFKHLLRQISFHKGAYFITADKSNSALARAEGLNSVYYEKRQSQNLFRNGQLVKARVIKFGRTPVTLTVPIGKVIYELAVQYGRLTIRTPGLEFELGCDIKGASLDHWVDRDLLIDRYDFEKALKYYNSKAKFSMYEVARTWAELNEHLSGSP